jgi:hypothetical protein
MGHPAYRVNAVPSFFVRPTKGKRNCGVRNSTRAAHLHDSVCEAMMSLGTGRITNDFIITSRIELGRPFDWPVISPWNAESLFATGVARVFCPLAILENQVNYRLFPGSAPVRAELARIPSKGDAN